MAAPRRRSTRILTACFGLLLVIAGDFSAFSYSLNGYRWPDGAQIVMHLQLTRDINGLQDGSASWNASAGDALNVWNQYIDTVQFVAADPTSSSGADGANEVLFSSTVYGSTWGTGVLAVTLKMASQGSLFTETDVLFNDNLHWDSYRGPLQGSGPTGTWDLHRVALHEFGHVLGLDHPDTHGQTVTAQMNSVISDLDQLAEDDIAGVGSLYAFRVTSNLKPTPVEIGTSFSYQVTANNQPLGYGASGLPAGLHFDPGTGLITGTPTESGTFSVILSVHGSRRDVTATLVIQITPRRIVSPLGAGVDIGGTFSYFITADNSPTSFEAIGLPSGLQLNTKTGQITGVPDLSGTYSITVIAHGSFGDAVDVVRLVVNAVPVPTPVIATFPILSYSGIILADPQRPYLYLPSSSNGIIVLDANTLTVKTTVPVSGFVGDMAISADGNRLWLAYDPSNGADYKIRSIDLRTFTVLPDLPVSIQPMRIREGLNGRLYVSEFAGKVWAVDSATGTAQGPLVTIQGTPALAVSADRTILFVGAQRGSPAGILRYDVSGATPRLLDSADAGNYGWYLTLSNTGKYVCLTTNPTSSPDGTKEFSATDLHKNLGTLVMDSPISLAFSPDDSRVYQTSQRGSYVGVYDAASCQLLKRIELGTNSYASAVAVDSSGSYVFVVGAAVYGSTWVRVYPANTAPRPIGPPHTLLNISTRLSAEGGDNALIGGFILRGSEQKNVALRAMGPSLPIQGKLGDPVLQLFDSTGRMIAQNDNWNAHRADVLATGIPPGDEHEAVITLKLSPDSYTAVVRGVNDATGVALVEAYDLNPGSSSKLANISTRGRVETGDNVMIGGFILGGDQTTTVVVRGLGPSLANYNIAGTLADPRLEVYDGNGTLIAQDDAWRQFQEQALIQSGLAPTDDREAAMILVLQPGAYTAIVRGENNTTGVGLVEVYNLETN